MKRRDFIARGSRWFLFGGLLGTSGYLIYRRRFGNPETCFVNPFCNGCNQFQSCGKVAELKEAQHGKKEGK